MQLVVAEIQLIVDEIQLSVYEIQLGVDEIQLNVDEIQLSSGCDLAERLERLTANADPSILRHSGI